MKDELDKQLCEKYPKIFRDRHASMQETCMCWGFEIGDGWYQIIDSLCAGIQWRIDQNIRDRALRANLLREARAKKEQPDDWLLDSPSKIQQVVATQIKEKFGGLRFYYTGGDDVIWGMVRMAEAWAEHTCETCGNPGKLQGKGWLSTKCDEHK